MDTETDKVKSEQSEIASLNRTRRVIFLLSMIAIVALLGSRMAKDIWPLRVLLGQVCALTLLSSASIVVFRVHRAPRFASYAMLAACLLAWFSEIIKTAADIIPAFDSRLASLGDFMLALSVVGWVAFMTPALFEMAVGRLQLARETEKLRAAQEIRQSSEQRYKALFENASEAIAVVAPKSGTIRAFNESFCSLCGYSREEMTDLKTGVLLDGIAPEVEEGVDQALNGVTVRLYDIEIVRKGGAKLRIDLSFSPLPGNEILALVRDMTQRKEFEERLRQLQNIDSIGRLAGGVAHDFNNILTPILGFSELLLDEAPQDHPWRPDIQEIHKAAEHARQLTQQLLAVGRRQALQMQTVDLGKVVEDFQSVIRRTIRENIEITVRCVPSAGHINADINQLKQILMNLCVNAQDAMPDGGRLAIEVKNADSGPVLKELCLEGILGPCVMLSVSDTGAGMNQEALSKAFEPFFTTRDEGTGLGLATVYGIVKQHGGYVRLQSESGRGTTAEMFFPKAEEKAERAEKVPVRKRERTGAETILVVEDNDSVRDLICSALEKLGYHTLRTRNGNECLSLVEELKAPVDLLVTDVIMPGMNGKELYNQLNKRQPGLRVIYMSGYPDAVISRHGVLDEGIHFIAKPVVIVELREMIRKVLET